MDRIPLSLIPTDHSYGRTLGLSGFYYYDVPTPGVENGTGYYGYAQNPTLSLPGGEYKGEIEVTINVPEGTVVYYTLDSSIPTEETGIRYEGETFTFNKVYKEPGKLPFKLTTGEYPLYRTVGKEARPGHVEFYDKEGNTLIDQDCEFGLQGQYSLDMPQKTFKVRAKAKYGNKYFDAKLFEDLPFTQYKSFVLRMGGNDSVLTRSRASSSNASTKSATIPATCFIRNGGPWWSI